MFTRPFDLADLLKEAPTECVSESLSQRGD
jgi:hypothetical protein